MKPARKVPKTFKEVARRQGVKSKLNGLELFSAVAESSGFTQTELASLLDVAQSTISKAMTGAGSIGLDHAKRAARYFQDAPRSVFRFKSPNEL